MRRRFLFSNVGLAMRQILKWCFLAVAALAVACGGESRIDFIIANKGTNAISEVRLLFGTNAVPFGVRGPGDAKCILGTALGGKQFDVVWREHGIEKRTNSFRFEKGAAAPGGERPQFSLIYSNGGWEFTSP